MTQTAETALLPSEETETVKEPAKAWRNRWFSEVQIRTPDGLFGPGPHFGTMIHPSRDIAETEAARLLQKYHVQAALAGLEYLGAFPADSQ